MAGANLEKSHDTTLHIPQSKMDDDEIQLVEVTVRTGSPTKKRKRKELLPPRQESTETPSNNNVLYKAAQLKRRLAFCEKEREELSKRFKEIKDQLTEEQTCQLDVKLENSDRHQPLICIGDSSDGDDDIIFVPPEDYSPVKRRKLDDTKKAETFENNGNQPKTDVAITYFKPATNLPHARENCAVHKFVQSNVTTSTVSCNEIYCEQCYCFVCDAPVKECDSWKTGTNPHCNGYAKNTFWEKLRKMAKRKTIAVQDSLLKCLPENERSDLLQAAAAKATELLETLKDEINNSAHNSRPSSPACGCECHDCDSDDSYGGYGGDGCRWCYEDHMNSAYYDWPFSGYGGLTFSLSSDVSNTVSKASEYLKSDQPGQAAVVLDALTVLLLAADNDSHKWSFSQINAALKSLRKAWIEVLMHPDLPTNVEDKIRERLKNANNGALICSPQSTGLKEVLEMKKWNDETLVKCFAHKLGDNFIVEDEDVAAARLAFLEKNKRFSDALYYLLDCKVTQRNSNSSMFSSSSEKRLLSITSYRHKFIVLLAKSGKIDQALNVLTVPGSAELEKDILTITTRKEVGINVNYSQCALGSMSYSDVKELLTAIVMDNNSTDTGKLPAPQTIPEEKLRKVLTVVLTGAHINSSLRTETAFEWYIDSFCESSLSNNLAKDVSQKFAKEAEQLLIKGKNKLLATSDITPPFKGPFKVFVVELFAALAVNTLMMNNYYQAYSITNTLGVFKRKGLQWACISVVLSPTITNKITPQILGFVLENVIKQLGSSCIPFQVYESWIKKLPDLNGIEKNYEIAHFILNEGKRQPGGNQANNNGMLLAKKIVETIESMLNKTSNWDKEKLSRILKKIKKEFGSGLKDLDGKIMSLSFTNDPSFKNFEGVRKTCEKLNWPQLRETMINFLKKHRTSHTIYCIDVFGQSLMFNEVKQTLAACGYNSSYPTTCDKIKQTLSKLKRDDACHFVEACADWLGKTLCSLAFQNWRYGYYCIADTMLSCLKAIADVKVETFNGILSAAMHEAANIFDSKTVQVKQRNDLERWLKDLKALYSSKNQMTAWSWAFHELTTGRLKRKPAVIRQLTNSNGLSAGTIPYHQLLKMIAATSATNTASPKPVQATASSKQTVSTASGAKGPGSVTPKGAAANMAASTSSITYPVKPAQVTGAPKRVVKVAASTPTDTTCPNPGQGPSAKGGVNVNMAVSTPPNTTTAKPAQRTTAKRAVNMAASTPTNIVTAKPGQGTAAKRTVSMAASTPSNSSIIKQAHKTTAKGAVNMAASTPTNIVAAKPGQGTATKNAVPMAASTPTNIVAAKPGQGTATKNAVPMAASTPTNIVAAKPGQGTATKNAVPMAASTPTNIVAAKPGQGTATKNAVPMAASTPTNIVAAKPGQGTATKNAVPMAASTPSNTTTTKPAPKQGVNIVVSTPNGISIASAAQSKPSTSQSFRVVFTPNQTTSGIKTQMPVIPLQLPNNIALNQQLVQAIGSGKRIVAGNNMVIRVPPGAANIPVATPHPVGTFVTIASNSTTAATVSRTASTVNTATTAVSASSAVVNSTNSTASRP